MYSNKFLSFSRGAVLVEASIVIPILILLAIGIIDVGMILHARSTAQAALEEGVRIAHRSPKLQADVWHLAATDSRAIDFINSRNSLASNVERIFDLTAVPSARLHGVEHHDTFAGAVAKQSGPLAIAYLPPAYSATVPELKREVTNSSFCNQGGVGVISQSADKGSANGCDRTQSMIVLSKQKPTELIAFVEVPTMLFGRFQTSVRAAAIFGEGDLDGNQNTATSTSSVETENNSTTTTLVDSVNTSTPSTAQMTHMAVFDFESVQDSEGFSWSKSDKNAQPLKGNVSWVPTQRDGVYRWSVPPGVSRLAVELWGGGGGALGRCAVTVGMTRAESVGALLPGGGAGGYGRGIYAVTPGQTIDIVVGAGGATGCARGGNGVDGDSSKVSDLIHATGGQAGGVIAGGNNGSWGVGRGGTSNGMVRIDGQRGTQVLLDSGMVQALAFPGASAAGSLPGMVPGGGGTPGFAGSHSSIGSGSGAHGRVVLSW